MNIGKTKTGLNIPQSVLSLIVGVVSVLSFSLTPITSVFATSGYDNTINALSDLKYNDTNEGVYSIANTWRTHFKNACGATVYNDFLASLDGGAYAVTQEGTDDDYGVTVIWSKPDHAIPDSGFYNANGGTIKYLATDPGWQGKARFHFNSTSDQEVCGYSTVAFNNPYGSTLDREADDSQLGVFKSSYEVNYPSGYEGQTVPFGSMIYPIIGNVQCGYGNNQITIVSVDVTSGIDGSATISSDGNGGKYYSYYLSEDSPYTLHVECDSSQFVSPLVDDNLYDNYNWVCTVQSSQYVCAYA